MLLRDLLSKEDALCLLELIHKSLTCIDKKDLAEVID
jgi:hypothetical protein